MECESGTEYSAETGLCEACRRGYYRVAADRQDACERCPIDTITPSTGSTSSVQCTIGESPDIEIG